VYHLLKKTTGSEDVWGGKEFKKLWYYSIAVWTLLFVLTEVILFFYKKNKEQQLAWITLIIISSLKDLAILLLLIG